jgi:hypothetical protein
MFKARMPLVPGVAAILSLCCLPSPSAAAPSNLGWTTFHNEHGASVEYPRALLPVEGEPVSSKGVLFATPDGRGRLEIFSIPNRRSESPAAFTSRIAPGGEQLSYRRVSRRFFAASTMQNGRILYRRCNFSGVNIHCIDIRYPAEEKGSWDRIVTRISLSLRPN